MKGVIGPMVSVLLLLAIGLAVGFWMRATTTIEKSTTERNAELITTVNEGDVLRKTLGEGLDLIAKRSAYDLGKGGGGFGEWKKDSPSIDNIKTKLAEEISSRIKKLEQTSVGDDKITSMESSFKAEFEKDPCVKQSGADYTDSRCFVLNGNYKAGLRNEIVNADLKATGEAFRPVSSSYFGMASIGRKFMVDYSEKIQNDIDNSLKPLKTSGSVKDSKSSCPSSLRAAICDCEPPTDENALKKTDFNQIEGKVQAVANSINDEIKSKEPYSSKFYGAQLSVKTTPDKTVFSRSNYKNEHGSLNCGQKCSPSGDCTTIYGCTCQTSVDVEFTFIVNSDLKLSQQDKNSLAPVDSKKPLEVPVVEGGKTVLKKLEVPLDYLSFIAPFKYSGSIRAGSVTR